MAWEWSHAGEAYRNAELNCHDLPRADLLVCAAEWKASDFDDDNYSWQFDAERYDAELAALADWDDERLARFIWANAEELATCDNGGWNAWLCPHGCHTISFDREPVDGDDNL